MGNPLEPCNAHCVDCSWNRFRGWNSKSLHNVGEEQIQSSSSLAHRIEEKHKIVSFWSSQNCGEGFEFHHRWRNWNLGQAKQNLQEQEAVIWHLAHRLNCELRHYLLDASSFAHCPENNIQNRWHESEDYFIELLSTVHIIVHVVLVIKFLLGSLTLYKSWTQYFTYSLPKSYSSSFPFDSG